MMICEKSVAIFAIASDLGKNVSADLIDLYKCCLVRDPSNRMSASKLLEHSFLQIQVVSKY